MVYKSSRRALKTFTDSAKPWFSGKELQSSEAQTEIAPSPFESRWAVARELAEERGQRLGSEATSKSLM